MKSVICKNIREWDAATIKNKIAEYKKDIVELKFKKATTGFDKPHLFSEIRKSIARFNTILAEKSREEK